MLDVVQTYTLHLDGSTRCVITEVVFLADTRLEHLHVIVSAGADGEPCAALCIPFLLQATAAGHRQTTCRDYAAPVLSDLVRRQRVDSVGICCWVSMIVVSVCSPLMPSLQRVRAELVHRRCLHSECRLSASLT